MIIIAGYVPVPESKRAALQPLLETYVAAVRAEPGCRAFEVAYDALDPERLRFFELFDDEQAFAAHDAAPHVATWRAARTALGLDQRFLHRFDATSSRPL